MRSAARSGSIGEGLTEEEEREWRQKGAFNTTISLNRRPTRQLGMSGLGRHM